MTTDTHAMTLCPVDFEVLVDSDGVLECSECHRTYSTASGKLVEVPDKATAERLHDVIEEGHEIADMIDEARNEPDQPRYPASPPVDPVIEFLRETSVKGYSDSMEFVNDVARKWIVTGKLSVGQRMAIEKIIAKRASWEKQDTPTANAPAMVAGKQTFEGTVISAKTRFTQFGESVKIIVKDSDGNRYWGTFPVRAHEQLGFTQPLEAVRLDQVCAAALNRKVRVTADVTVSEDDTHFGFFHRPKVEVL